MTTAKENIERYEREIDWQKWVDMALQDPPSPWQLAAWVGHYGRDFDVAYGHWPTIENYPAPVRAFFETLAKVAPKGRPRCDQSHLVKVRQAWAHAVFRDGYEMNLDVAQAAKKQGIPYNGRKLLERDAPSLVVMEDIAETTEFDSEQVRNQIYPRKKPLKK